jgi:hypothetical protein
MHILPTPVKWGQLLGEILQPVQVLWICRKSIRLDVGFLGRNTHRSGQQYHSLKEKTEQGSHYVARLASNLRSSCLSFLSTGITGMCYMRYNGSS